MKIKSFHLLLAIFASILFSTSALSQQEEGEYSASQMEADALYDEGKHRQAYYKYRDLARRGDSFSQYRLSILHLGGHGTDKDIVDAYAWAVLAAQNKNPDLVAYRDTVYGAVPEDSRDTAKKQADKLLRRWGNHKIARTARKSVRRNLRSCTGSRLGSTCEFVYAGSMPSGVAIACGSDDCGPANGRAAVGRGTESQNQSPATRDVAYYQELRQTMKALDQHIEAEGNVEIGELEVSEDSPQ